MLERKIVGSGFPPTAHRFTPVPLCGADSPVRG